MNKIIRVLGRKGNTTIPFAIRMKAGFNPQDVISFEVKDRDIIRANVKNAENHIASTIFKLAGEQATLNLLVADQLIGDIDDETIRAYRNDACF